MDSIDMQLSDGPTLWRAGVSPNLGDADEAIADAGGDATAASAKTEYRNYRSLVERAIDVFGDELKASLWLSTPSSDLAGKIPMQVAQTVQYSASELERIFEPIFIRIEHGIYS